MVFSSHFAFQNVTSFHPYSLFTFPKGTFEKVNRRMGTCQTEYFKIWSRLIYKADKDFSYATCVWSRCKRRKLLPRELTYRSCRNDLGTGKTQQSLSKTMRHPTVIRKRGKYKLFCLVFALMLRNCFHPVYLLRIKNVAHFWIKKIIPRIKKYYIGILLI